TLQDLGASKENPGNSGKPDFTVAVGPRLARFELVLLRELGYSPALDVCAVCESPVKSPHLAFSAAAGGVLCPVCAKQNPDARGTRRDRRPLSPGAWEALRALGDSREAWQRAWSPAVRTEVRQVLGQ